MGEDSIDKSGYNEASYKMQRLNEFQSKIAYVNQDLGLFYEELGAYGYLYKITQLENLVAELWGKMGDSERKRLLLYRKVIRDLIELYPIYKQEKVNSVGEQKNTKQLNRTNLNKLAELLFEYNMYINELLEKAGYSTFTVDTYEGDPFN